MKFSKLKLVLYFGVTLFAFYVLYLRFLRYFLADNESIAIAMLNPNQLPVLHPVLFSSIMLFILFLGYMLFKIKPSSTLVFRTMKGFYGYSLVIILLQLIIVLGSQQFPKQWNRAIIESENLFVEVKADNTRLRAEPSLDSTVLDTVKQGTLLLLNDVRRRDEHTWNRVLLAPKKYAWIIRTTKVSGGVTKRLTQTNKFYFTLADQVSLLLAFVGFVWGFLSYSIRKG